MNEPAKPALCGGRTKDGKRCSRILKPGATRCWQHAKGLKQHWKAIAPWGQGLIVIIGLIGSLVTIWTFVKAQDTAKEHAHMVMTEVYPSYLNPTMPLGVPLAFNVNFHNIGQASAEHVATDSHLYIRDGLSLESAQSAVQEFSGRNVIYRLPLSEETIAPQIPDGWFTATGPKLTQAQHEKLWYGTQVLYIVAAVRYKDSYGWHETHLCQGLQPPQPGFSLIWQNCRVYNDSF
jgi:hypothetical protein